MILLLRASLAAFFLGGLAAFLLSRTPERASLVGCLGVAAGCVPGLFCSAYVLASGLTVSTTLPCGFPVGAVAVRLDPLSAFFLLPIFLLAPLAAVYARGYLRDHGRQDRIGTHWLHFALFLSGMVLVVAARDSILFLVAWEGMTVASYFLVVLDDEKPAVRAAGRIYLILSHIGVACLMAMFLLLGGKTGETDFALFHLDGGTFPATAVFILALIGFGLKAGFVPLHVWLPEAHPAAPSHISAMMSGVMIKLGIYGLLRVLLFCHGTPIAWAYGLIGIGMITGIFGILFALAQRDIKRLLAYSSIENIGIITMAIGVGLFGVANDSPRLAALGLAGGLLHVLNHAIFKGLLFLGAGSIQHATETRNIERLGGLLQRMRWTGLAFLIGSAAICGLPPLNGFVSEFLIYLGCFRGGAGAATSEVAAVLFGVVVAMALIGVLAVACFAKAFGIMFLGEPRTESAEQAHESSSALWAPMLVLAVACILIGVVGPFALGLLEAPITQFMTPGGLDARAALQNDQEALRGVTSASFCLLLLAAGLAWLRFRLLAGRTVKTAGTWDCGYAAPTPRMQYTASSFADPITSLFSPLLRIKRRFRKPVEHFPQPSSLHRESDDTVMSRLYGPFLTLLYRATDRIRVLQHGNTHLYVLYIAVTLLAFLFWTLRSPA